MTYTATYTVNRYKVTFIADGETVSEQVLDYGTAITAPEAPEKEGHTFSTWGDVAATVPAADVTYTATYTVNQYRVTFIADGETVSEQVLDYGTAITAPEAPEKEGHTFSTWGDVAATVPAADVTYTATYTVNQYKVTFIADGETVADLTLDYGTPIAPPEAPEKEGHTFSTWGEVAETVPATDVTYTATYTVNKYIVRYFVNGELIAEDELEYGAPIILREYYVEDWGYTIKNWIGTIYETMPAHDIMYQASLADAIKQLNNEEMVDVWTLDGHKVGKYAKNKINESLRSGIYFIQGKKVFIR